MDPSCNWQTCLFKVVERGEYLIESGELSDCKFIVGQEPQQQVIQGHKVFLGMSSPVFKAMLYGSLAEENDLIPIRDVQPEAFRTLLKYIYTDKIELKSFELARDLLYCGKKYMLPYVVEQCTTYLGSDLSPAQACSVYELSRLFEELALNEKCMNVICTKTTEVLNALSWEEIELDTLLTIFEKDTLQIDSEIKLLAAAERWAKAECKRKSLNPSDTNCLRSVIGNALSKIRFLTLTSQQFADGINESLLLTKDEAFAIFMNISSSKTNTSMPENFSINSLPRKITPNFIEGEEIKHDIYGRSVRSIRRVRL